MWPEDEEDEFGFPFEALAGYLSVPANNFDKYGNAVPLTANNSANYTQDIFQMLTNPQTAMIMAALTGQPTVDYMQQPVDEEPAPIAFTPTLDSLRLEDPELASIIESGTSYATIAKGIREANEDPEGELAATKDQLEMARAAINERSQAAKEFAEFNARPVPLSPLEEQYRKAGLPMPWEQYTGETVDGDFGLYDAAAQQSRQTLERRMPRDQKALDTFLQTEADPLPAGERVGPNGENLFLQQFLPGGRYASPAAPRPEPAADAPWISHSFDTGILDEIGRRLDPDAYEERDSGPTKMWMGPDAPTTANRPAATAARPKFDHEASRHRARRQKLQSRVRSNERYAEGGTMEEKAARDAKNIAALRARQAGRTPNSDAVQQRLALLRAAGIPI